MTDRTVTAAPPADLVPLSPEARALVYRLTEQTPPDTADQRAVLADVLWAV